MSRQSLFKLAIQYFAKKGYIIEKNLPENNSLLSHKKFDLIVKRGSEVHLVWIKEWDRTVGVNIVINVDKAAQSVGFSHPILIAERFSEHAKAYASRRGIKLLTKSDIIRGIRTL